MKYQKVLYKYVLFDNFQIQLAHTRVPDTISTEHFTLMPDGMVYGNKGYAWDGPSGPTIDTAAALIASIPHDILYQCHRMGYPINRKDADEDYRDILLGHGVSQIRALIHYRVLRRVGWLAAAPKQDGHYEIIDAVGGGLDTVWVPR